MAVHTVKPAQQGLRITDPELREKAAKLSLKWLIARIDDELTEQALAGQHVAALIDLATETPDFDKGQAALAVMTKAHGDMDDRLCRLGGLIDCLIDHLRGSPIIAGERTAGKAAQAGPFMDFQGLAAGMSTGALVESLGDKLPALLDCFTRMERLAELALEKLPNSTDDDASRAVLEALVMCVRTETDQVLAPLGGSVEVLMQRATSAQG